ncbi:MAG: transcriptional regulator [Chitinispirillia bacterium]|nr:transcriptional regulator [Chitinispirillia bacterium]MCL2241228.1 transcriptional regulator [Chitinispirillia bacterium]
MKYYERFVNLGCFTMNDVTAITGNRDTAHSIVESYKKKGLIEAVRRNLFAAISLETKQPVPNRYAIASHAAPGAYVACHSAFEYYGLANQIYYEAYAASVPRFREFEYGGLTYCRVPSPFENGVESKPGGIRITNLERTVIDGINTFDTAGGLEELLRCIEMIPSLDHSKLTEYLKCYNKAVLYQKTGYILEHFKAALKLPDKFFASCQRNAAKSKRYLQYNSQGESYALNKNWALYTPGDLMAVTRKGAISDEQL